jgi:hypothetical protein
MSAAVTGVLPAWCEIVPPDGLKGRGIEGGTGAALSGLDLSDYVLEVQAETFHLNAATHSRPRAEPSAAALEDLDGAHVVSAGDVEIDDRGLQDATIEVANRGLVLEPGVLEGLMRLEVQAGIEKPKAFHRAAVQGLITILHDCRTVPQDGCVKDPRRAAGQKEGDVAGGRIARMQEKGGMSSGNKRIAWIMLGVLFGITWLGIGIGQLEFAPATRYARSETRSQDAALTKLVEEIAEVPIGKLILAWGLVILIMALVIAILSPELRKRLLRALIRTAAFVLIVSFAVQRNPGLLSLLDPTSDTGAAGTQGGEASLPPPPVFEPPRIAPLAAYLVSLVVVLAVLGAAWRLRGWWIRRTASADRRNPLEEIAHIAHQSMEDLVGGRDWGNAIIRCYDQMGRVVDRRRGLARAASMTPAEFAGRLQAAGLPAQPVERLTRLFERARYGGRAAGKPEIEEAADCLGAIARACGEAT